jgi:4a-hydroxytetrahydrobiopterin dehydratase
MIVSFVGWPGPRRASRRIAKPAQYGTVAPFPSNPARFGERIAMESALAEKSCTPCRGGIPPLSREEAEDYRRQAPDWTLADGATRIERTYRFKNFGEAFGFVERAASLAETEMHHPDISFGWGYATVSLRTKKIKGLHENDFIMAAKLDRLGSTVEAG